MVETKKTVEKKTKRKENSKVAFPVEGTVNKWGFIHLSNEVSTAFGAVKGQKTSINIDMQDDALIVKKA